MRATHVQVSSGPGQDHGDLQNCIKCGPELWDYARGVRASPLDEMVKAELDEAGIRGE